jgi:hypothetical protein
MVPLAIYSQAVYHVELSLKRARAAGQKPVIPDYHDRTSLVRALANIDGFRTMGDYLASGLAADSRDLAAHANRDPPHLRRQTEAAIYFLQSALDTGVITGDPLSPASGRTTAQEDDAPAVWQWQPASLLHILKDAYKRMDPE